MARWIDPVDRQPGDVPAISRSADGVTYRLAVWLTARKARATLIIRRDERGTLLASIVDIVQWQQ